MHKLGRKSPPKKNTSNVPFRLCHFWNCLCLAFVFFASHVGDGVKWVWHFGETLAPLLHLAQTTAGMHALKGESCL